jgi:hypothetical protein
MKARLPALLRPSVGKRACTAACLAHQPRAGEQAIRHQPSKERKSLASKQTIKQTHESSKQTRKQTRKQTSKRTNKETIKQASKQTNKQTNTQANKLAGAKPGGHGGIASQHRLVRLPHSEPDRRPAGDAEGTAIPELPVSTP